MKERPILFSTPMVSAILEGRKTQTRRILKNQSKKLLEAGYPIQPLDVIPMPNSKKPNEKEWVTLQKRLPEGNKGLVIGCRHGEPGDRLWVKETFRITGWSEDGDWLIQYKDGTEKWFLSVEEISEETTVQWWEECTNDCIKAGHPMDEEGYYHFTEEHPAPTRWRPSIFMPKWASRITLEILHVRVERLQKISRDDARAEGVSGVWIWNKEKNPEYFRRSVLNPYVANFSVLWDSINAKSGFGWDSNPWVWVIEFTRVQS